MLFHDKIRRNVRKLIIYIKVLHPLLKGRPILKIIDRIKHWMTKNKIEEIPQPQPQPMEPSTPSHLVRSLNIRTTAIYPKDMEPFEGERESAIPDSRRPAFKFPLIPDHPSEGDLELIKQKKEVEPVFVPQKTQQKPRIQPEVKPVRVENNTKRRFRPTQVVSPIYGYHRPKPKDEPELEVKQEPVTSAFEDKPLIQAGEAFSFQDTRVEALPKEERETSTEPIVAIQVENSPIEWVVEEEKVMEPIDSPTLVVTPLVEERVPVMASSIPTPRVNEFVQVASIPTPRVNEAVQMASIPTPRVHEAVQVEETPSTIYHRPYGGLLKPVPPVRQGSSESVLRQQEVLAETLRNFHVNAEVIGAVQGPSVTRYEIQPAAGVKVNKITNLADDLKLSLAARDIRIEAPIPGRSAIGIEVPNEKSRPVYLREIIESEAFRFQSSFLTVALGVDIGGKPVVADLSTMPHGLIAGATGSGKSVCIHSLIMSLLFKSTPEQVRLLLIDPKMVELAVYNRLPHLVTPVVTDPKQATAALKWAVEEMDRRYEQFAEAGVRDLSRYNDLMKRTYPGGNRNLPFIVIIIDELADLMMVAPTDVEEAICRVAQKARACGIHLLVATQRPSVDVITGLIKANIPTRIAFSVSSQTDSRTILDMGGAERLLGRGDMLYMGSGTSKPVRLQGPYISDDEIEEVTTHIKSQREPAYLFEREALNVSVAADDADDLFADAVLFCIDNGQASASSLQRNFRIGYNRAARLIDMMEHKGFISGQSGSKSRDVFITLDEFEEIFLQ